MLTIVTATYNRAHTLPNLYKSILKNKKFDKDITWLIIDDGSVDNTKELVNKWIKEKQIKIKKMRVKWRQLIIILLKWIQNYVLK